MENDILMLKEMIVKQNPASSSEYHSIGSGEDQAMGSPVEIRLEKFGTHQVTDTKWNNFVTFTQKSELGKIDVNRMTRNQLMQFIKLYRTNSMYFGGLTEESSYSDRGNCYAAALGLILQNKHNNMDWYWRALKICLGTKQWNFY